MALTSADIMQPQARAAQANLLEISNIMQEVFIDAGSIDIFITGISSLLSIQINTAQQIRMSVASMSRHSLISFSETLYQDIVENVREAQNSAINLLSITKGLSQTNNVGAKYSDLDLSDVLLHLYKIESMLSYLDSQCSIVSNLSIQLSPEIEYIYRLSSIAVNSLAEIDENIAQAEMLLLCAGDDIQILAEILGPLPSSEQFSGSGESGSGGLVSGSGLTEEEPGFLESENIASVAEQIAFLRDFINQWTGQLLLYQVGIYDSANITALIMEGQRINR